MPTPLYPLRFEPLFQYRPWGGQRLAAVFGGEAPSHDLIGEAWILSDRDEHPSLVANGAFAGRSLNHMLSEWPEACMGRWVGRFARFPLLLKFLDVKNTLSVQVHPADAQSAYLPAGETGKTEAWVVLQSSAESRIYAGLLPNTSPADVRKALAGRSVAKLLASFTPRIDDAVLIPAGTVHSLHDIVVFEVQQNSDVTFRLYDWDQQDPKTHQRRPLQVERAMACIDFAQAPITRAIPEFAAAIPRRERLIACAQFSLWRITSPDLFTVGAPDTPRVIVCIAGAGQIEHNAVCHPVRMGDAMLLPAAVGRCMCRPTGPITLLEVMLPSDV